jgi:hypothetical protein
MFDYSTCRKAELLSFVEDKKPFIQNISKKSNREAIITALQNHDETVALLKNLAKPAYSSYDLDECFNLEKLLDKLRKHLTPNKSAPSISNVFTLSKKELTAVLATQKLTHLSKLKNPSKKTKPKRAKIASVVYENGRYTYRNEPILVQKEYLEGGSYGHVFDCRFRYKGRLYAFALKQAKNCAKLGETELIEKLGGQFKQIQNTLPYKPITTSAIIMPLAQGNLKNICNKLNIDTYNRICISLLKTLFNVLKFHVYYFDVKIANLLYVTSGRELEVYIGDIGSILPNHDGSYPATHPISWLHSQGFIYPAVMTYDEIRYKYAYQVSLVYAKLALGDEDTELPSYAHTDSQVSGSLQNLYDRLAQQDKLTHKPYCDLLLSVLNYYKLKSVSYKSEVNRFLKGIHNNLEPPPTTSLHPIK